jgi:hypothetical protein
MRRGLLILVAVGAVVAMGLVAKARFDTKRPEGSGTEDMIPLEQVLGRPIVIYAEGALPAGLSDNLLALDVEQRALDRDATPQSLLDTDVYVSIQDNWAVFTQAKRHVLHGLMVEKLQGVSAEKSFVWFSATASEDGQAKKEILVILGNGQALSMVQPFCQAVILYDMARFLTKNAAAVFAPEGPTATWKQCGDQGWTGVSDMASDPSSATPRP